MKNGGRKFWISTRYVFQIAVGSYESKPARFPYTRWSQKKKNWKAAGGEGKGRNLVISTYEGIRKSRKRDQSTLTDKSVRFVTAKTNIKILLFIYLFNFSFRSVNYLSEKLIKVCLFFFFSFCFQQMNFLVLSSH